MKDAFILPSELGRHVHWVTGWLMSHWMLWNCPFLHFTTFCHQYFASISCWDRCISQFHCPCQRLLCISHKLGVTLVLLGMSGDPRLSWCYKETLQCLTSDQLQASAWRDSGSPEWQHSIVPQHCKMSSANCGHRLPRLWLLNQVGHLVFIMRNHSDDAYW